MPEVNRLRDWIGQAMRRVGLHYLSGWWDAGTDLRGTFCQCPICHTLYSRRSGQHRCIDEHTSNPLKSIENEDA
jgi:hypothetical protein